GIAGRLTKAKADVLGEHPRALVITSIGREAEMRKLNRKIYLAVLAVAMAAMALPVIGVKVGAAGGGSLPAKTAPAPVPAVPAPPSAASASAAMAGGNSSLGMQRAAKEKGEAVASEGGERRLSDDIVLKAFGIERASRGRNALEMSKTVSEAVSSQLSRRSSARSEAITPEAGEPTNMMACSALSAAVATTAGGRDTQFDEVLTLGD